MSNPLTTVENYIANVVHHTRIAVEAAEAHAKADAAYEKALIAKDIRATVVTVQAAVKADTPEIEAAVKKGIADTIAAVETALKAHGV